MEHLTADERRRLETLLNRGESFRSIAEISGTIALANAVLVPETTFAAPEIFFPTVFVVFLTISYAVSNPTRYANTRKRSCKQSTSV